MSRILITPRSLTSAPGDQLVSLEAAGFQLVDFRLIDIESQTSETCGGKCPNQGETDVAKADDPGPCRARSDLLF